MDAWLPLHYSLERLSGGEYMVLVGGYNMVETRCYLLRRELSDQHTIAEDHKEHDHDEDARHVRLSSLNNVSYDASPSMLAARSLPLDDQA